MRKSRARKDEAPTTEAAPTEQQPAANANETIRTALSTAEVAARWGCTPQVVHAMVKSKKLYGFPVGNRGYRVPLAEVLRIESGPRSA